MNSAGRGRVKIFNQTTLFSFETVNTPEKFWKMAVDIPIHGEELLSIGWENADKSQVQLKGGFARRLINSSKADVRSKKYSHLIKGFMKGWAQVLLANDLIRKNKPSFECTDGKCLFGSGKWLTGTSPGHYFLDYEIREGELLRFDFSNFKEDSPRRVSITPVGQTLETTPFQIDLFVNTCE